MPRTRPLREERRRQCARGHDLTLPGALRLPNRSGYRRCTECDREDHAYVGTGPAPGRQATHCPRGHPYVPGSYYLAKKDGRVVGRRCKICHNCKDKNGSKP